MRLHIKLLLLIVTLSLAACAELVVKEVDYAPALIVPENANPRPVKFSQLRFLLPPGTEIGLESGIGPGLGAICSLRNYPVSRRITTRAFETKWIKETFAQSLEANGYDVVDSLDIDFRPEDELQRAEYFVSARVKDLDVDVCHRGIDSVFSWFGRRPGVKGRLYALIDWSVYDALRRTVVYKVTTEGYSKRNYPNLEGFELLFFDAFEMAAHNLAADEDFYNLIVEGAKPPPEWKNKPYFGRPVKTDGPRLFDTEEKVDIKALPLSRQPVPKHIEDIRDVVVMPQKTGHGSGFFITKEGHILTNQHIVGDAQRMRIVTNGKKHKLIAEVLRIDKVRDVALLKLENKPDSLTINPLPIRTDKLTVSEDVYAIGTPKDYRAYQSTVTKGIVSAHRLYKDEGVRMPFIQADVEVHPGNSGGILLDEYGNIVGVTVSGFVAGPSNTGVGLNNFIPITEALRMLDITIDGKEPPNYQTRSDEKEEDSPDESHERPIPLSTP